jgi:hypothetical protein
MNKQYTNARTLALGEFTLHSCTAYERRNGRTGQSDVNGERTIFGGSGRCADRLAKRAGERNLPVQGPTAFQVSIVQAIER